MMIIDVVDVPLIDVVQVVQAVYGIDVWEKVQKPLSELRD
jgi:hypothetical protein